MALFNTARTGGFLAAIVLSVSLMPAWSQDDTQTAEELYQLGQRHEHGEGLGQDFSMAYEYYCSAAQAGHAGARHSIAWMYLNGRGVERDEAKAGYWLKASADAGDQHSDRLLKRLKFPTDSVDPACDLTTDAPIQASAEPDTITSTPDTDAAPEKQPEEPARVATAPLCHQVGPLDNDEQFSAVHDWLISKGNQPEALDREISYGLIYQVYSQPLDNRTAASKTASRFRSRGVNDLHVISTGVLRNGISLGAYRYEHQARQRVAELGELGISAHYRTQNPARLQRWLRFSTQDTGMIEALSVQFDAVTVEQTTCGEQQVVLTAQR